MGTGNSSNEYQEARQHLSLSDAAWAVLQDDRRDFGGGRSWAGILNYVFAMYRDKADASVSVAVSRRREQLEEQLGGVVSPAARDAVLDRLMEVYAGELAEKAMSDGAVAQQKEVFKFRLDRDNYAFREQWLDSPDAARYYGNRFSRYLRAVLEEYAAKTVYQREEIYFSQWITLILGAMEGSSLLWVELQNGNAYEVRPYGVLGDRQETYHYLVGLSRPDGTREPEKELIFRLSKIVKLDVSFRRSGRLTEKERTDIESSIRGKGVQFLAQQRETIRIRLTEEGRRDYGSQMHLRPPAQTRTAVDDGAYRWEYTFFCTEFQARAYFLKFCGDAKVVEPQSLRDTLAQEYRSGLRACGEEP